MQSAAHEFVSLNELSEIVPLMEVPPDDLSEMDDRRARRFEPCAPVEVFLTHADGSEQVGLLADISNGGARIIADEAPLAGALVEVALSVGKKRRPLAEGFVVHTDDSQLGCFGIDFACFAPVSAAPLRELSNPAFSVGDPLVAARRLN